MRKEKKSIVDLANVKHGLDTSGQISWFWGGMNQKKRMVVAGLGDVGTTLLTGLILLGREVIHSIGIYDVNSDACSRLLMELNQIVDPFEPIPFPQVYPVDENHLFDGDVFIFCVAKSVPAIGSEIADVRMAQFEANGTIISWYAKKAADEHFDGLFLVVSDPVELLCKAALSGSKKGMHPLHPYQITGCGLGVMNARAVYFARKHLEFRDYLVNGRVFGAHGKELVVANDIAEEGYDDKKSKVLTQYTLEANLEVRATGFKPFIAPALSSGALTVLRIVKEEWCYCSNYLGGVYFGGRNRRTRTGIAWESVSLPDTLFARLLDSYGKLEDIL